MLVCLDVSTTARAQSLTLENRFPQVLPKGLVMAG
ncbi:hypothetical protein AAKU55_000344 [Oxalobacteraceae bacterium GrIS 1.11]